MTTRRKIGWTLTGTLLIAGGCALLGRRSNPACAALEQLPLEQAKVLSTSSHSGGLTFSWRTALLGKLFFHLPPSCRVELQITPSADSDIRTEVWLPQTGWNGKFQGLGNGGFAGSIDTLSLTLALRKGYAAASTDTGHEGSDKDGSWALGHPEKIRDYGFRAIHQTALKAKALIAAFYGRPADHAYFAGGSNGGRAALMEAQRFPEDYDGILAGCPAYDGTNTLPTWAWIQKRIHDTPGAYIGPKKLKAIARAVVAACDDLDGVHDGVIDDPRRCAFQPETLQCAGEERDACLTPPQVQTLKDIYAGPGGALGESVHHGFEPGGELAKLGGWKDWFTGRKPGTSLEYIYALEYYRNLVYDDPSWNLDRFDFARDRPAMQWKIGEALDARDPDLTRFQARGGKLIVYQGWNDPALQPRLAVDYYERVQARMGTQPAAEFMRLYMVPGMQHCFGGPGPNALGQIPPAGDADPTRNINAALEAWVEKGRAPGPIIGAKYENDLKGLIVPEKTKLVRTRPVCPYPQVARWKGEGNTDRAENFICVMPPALPH